MARRKKNKGINLEGLRRKCAVTGKVAQVVCRYIEIPPSNRTFNPKENEGSIREFAIKAALKNDTEIKLTYLEFGVYNGSSINILSKLRPNKIFHGFDTF